MLQEQLHKITNLIEARRFERALSQIDLIDVNAFPDHQGILNFLAGLAHEGLEQTDLAVDSFAEAIDQGFDKFDASVHLTKSLIMMERFSDAAQSLEFGIARFISSANEDQWSHTISELFFHLHEYQMAIDWALRGQNTSALNLDSMTRVGTCWMRLNQIDQAIASYQSVLTIDPYHPRALYNLSVAYRRLKQPKDAFKCLELAGKLDHRFYDPASLSMLAASHLNFEQREKYKAEALLKIETTSETTSPREPFPYLFLTSAPKVILEANQHYSRWLGMTDHDLKTTNERQPTRQTRKSRLKIGYMSADFKQHATGFLAESLFRLHDRNQFEIIAINHTVDPDQYSETLLSHFDRHIDISSLNDQVAAQSISELDLDILVDLKGYTENARSVVLQYMKQIPVINFLGYPATMGNPLITYMIGDHVVFPSKLVPEVTESIIRLPVCYQPNNPDRIISPPTSRADHGIPKDAFVFACFNNHWKLNTQVLDTWKQILRLCPDAILWCLGSECQEISLKTTLCNLGFENHQIIEAPPMKPEHHLERIIHADLILDTFPCGGHTTTSDALFRRVPVVNLMGQAFHTRVSASLMHHAGVDLVNAQSIEEYIHAALMLYQDRELLFSLKETLSQTTSPRHPYNIKSTVNALEKAFWKVHERGTHSQSFDTTF